MRIDQGRALLSQLRYKAENDTYIRVLGIVSSTLKESKKDTEDATSRNSLFRTELRNQQFRLVNDLIGTAFVVCQAHINSICSRVKRIGEFLKSRGAATLFNNERQVRSLGEPFQAGSPISKVELIFAFANYYKHHDEWPWKWSDATGYPKRTIDAIQAAGAKRESTSNLVDGLRSLGATDATEVTALGNSIKPWIETLYESAYTALEPYLYPED
jgi:hypothetical protein